MISAGGPVGFPLLLILIFYYFQKPILRILCLAGVFGWIGIIVVLAIVHEDWNLLIFPAIVGIGWTALHPLLKDL